MPATILTPGLEEENKTKAEITKIIEESDQGSTPELLASKLLKSKSRYHRLVDAAYTGLLMLTLFLQGLESGYYLITTDFFGHVFRKAGAGVSPAWHGPTDIMWSLLSLVRYCSSSCDT
jgi:3-dehydrosphinganine reductase